MEKPIVIYTDHIMNRTLCYNFAKGSDSLLCHVDNFKEYDKTIATYGTLRGTFEVIKKQLSILPDQIRGKNLDIAYEPVWAIGTGLVASKQYIEDVLSYINNLIKELYYDEDRPNIRLFYGGSVDENSVEELSSISLLDGFLIGSASADFEKFKNMLNKMR